MNRVVIKILQGSVVTQTNLYQPTQLQISYSFMCQKLWKSVENRHSYCNNWECSFFHKNVTIIAADEIDYLLCTSSVETHSVSMLTLITTQQTEARTQYDSWQSTATLSVHQSHQHSKWSPQTLQFSREVAVQAAPCHLNITITFKYFSSQFVLTKWRKITNTNNHYNNKW